MLHRLQNPENHRLQTSMVLGVEGPLVFGGVVLGPSFYRKSPWVFMLQEFQRVSQELFDEDKRGKISFRHVISGGFRFWHQQKSFGGGGFKHMCFICFMFSPCWKDYQIYQWNYFFAWFKHQQIEEVLLLP